MELRIELDSPPSQTFYTPLDTVCGTVHLDVNESVTIDQIKIILKGRIQSTIIRTDDEDESVIFQERASWEDQHELFKTSNTIFPLDCMTFGTGGYAFGKGRHSFRFAIDFPTPSACEGLHTSLDLAQDQLPPSMNMVSPGLNTKVSYVLQTKVKRHGLMHRDVNSEKELAFISLDSLTSSERVEDIYFGNSTIAVPAETLGYPKISPTCSELPPYSPAILFEANLDGPTTLYASQALPLRLFVTLPGSIGRDIPVWIRSIHISLQSKTTVSVGCHSKTALSEVLIKDVNLNLPLIPTPETEVCELDSHMWKDWKLPKLAPSFKCSSIKREHYLQVMAEFVVNGKTSTPATILIQVNVRGGTPPPSYVPSPDYASNFSLTDQQQYTSQPGNLTSKFANLICPV